MQKKLYFGAILPDIGSQLSELQQFEIVFFSRLFNIIRTVVTKTKLFEMPLLEKNHQIKARNKYINRTKDWTKLF